MSGKEQDYIDQAFESNWIAPLGPNVDAFEQEMAEYAGVKGAAAVSSGTAAIHLGLELLGVEKGDRVFCSTFTFVASANPIVMLGAEPVFIDSEPDTWNMSPGALEEALKDADREGRLPRAVIAVHLYGQSAKMDEILEVCNRYDVPVLEDSAESLGSLYKGKKSGTLGKFGIYSFNGNKIITTSGGGMLVSDDEEALKRARFLATQAKDPAPYYQHSRIGYNYRMSNILAGIGRAQLQVLDERVEARRAVFSAYAEAFAGIEGVRMMPELEGTKSNRWLTALTIDPELGIEPFNWVSSMQEQEIEARLLWKPLHIQPLFKGTRFYPHGTGTPVSEQLFRTGLCLPSGSLMTREQQERVIENVQRLAAEKSVIC